MKKPIRDVIAVNVIRLMTNTPHADSPAKLAALAGIPKETIESIIAATIDADIDTIAAIASALNIQPFALLIADDAPIERDRERLAALPSEAQSRITRHIRSVITSADNVGGKPSADHGKAFSL